MGPQARAPGSGRQAHLFVAISVLACWNVAAQRDDKFRFLWRWHLFLIHFNYDNTKISCRWHLFLIHFNYENSQSVSQSVSRSRPALIRKYLVQLLISSHTIRQSAAPCREHVERVRLVRHRVFRFLMTVSVRNRGKRTRCVERDTTLVTPPRRGSGDGREAAVLRERLIAGWHVAARAGCDVGWRWRSRSATSS